MGLRLANRVAYWLVFRNIRRMIGLDRCHLAFTGAAPISPDLIRWYLALGLDMREVYGQTENCGVATLMPSDGIKLGSVGKAVPWGEVKLSPRGRNPDQGRLPVPGLSEPAGEDRRNHRRGRLAAHRRCRRHGQ